MFSEEIADIIIKTNRLIEMSLTDIEFIEEQKKYNGLHPHNESIFRFINSEYYDFDIFYKFDNLYKNSKDQNELLKIKEVALNENQENIKHQDFMIKNKGVRNIGKNDLLPYVNFFNVQLAAETAINGMKPPVMYTRHGYKNGVIKYHIVEAFRIIEILIECNKKKNWYDIINQGWTWSNHIISICWGLYEMGLAKYALKILEPFYETINIFIDNRELNRDNDYILNKFLDCDIFGSYPYTRVKSSTSWVLAMSYLQVGNIEKHLEILKSIIDYSKYSNYCYRVHTRHIEATIRIYELERTEENLEQIYFVFNKAITGLEPDENSESLMERCIAIYEFLYKIIDSN